MIDNNIAAHKSTQLAETTPLLILSSSTSSSQLINDGQLMYSARKELWWIIRNGLPLSFMLILENSASIVALICISRLGPDYITAAVIASGFMSLTCSTWVAGMSSALDTLCSQAFTASSQSSRLISLHVQRALAFFGCLMIPIIALFHNAEHIFLFIGQSPKTAYLAGHIVRVFTIQIPASIALNVFRRFLQSQGDMQTGTRIVCITGPMGAVLNYIFITVFEEQIGYIGCAYASIIADSIGAILIVRHSISLPTWSPWTSAAFSGWMPFIKLAIPSTFIYCNESWVVEIFSMVSSYFGSTAVAAQAIAFQCILLGNVVHIGISCAAANRIGNHIGAGKATLARINAWVALCVIAAIAFFYGLTVFIFCNNLARFYTNDKDVIKILEILIPIGTILHVFIGLTFACDGILRGQGRQSYGATVRIISFYLIGPLLGIFFTVHLKLEVFGLWITFICAALCTAVAEIVLIAKTNWLALSITSQQRVQNDEAIVGNSSLYHSNGLTENNVLNNNYAAITAADNVATLPTESVLV
ncbi:mate-domain-containing protein [Syncephalis fuscata]|nr:mate-domain-containing protein [Syncephalis fuscata]